MFTRNRMVAAAVAAALGTASANALAQDATDPNADSAMEEVVVSGIRYGIESSIAVKKNSQSIVESVSAEDIGKLPDTSIAESISRLPGLAAQRVNGRAQVISIRGLGPKYGSTLLNGREMVSTGDNRSVELDQFPSELINSATVYKTPDATLVGQGLSGTLNMQTIRPLKYDKRQIAFNGRLDKNSNGSLNADSEDRGGRYSMSYVDQFAEGKFGLAVGLAYLDAPNQEQHYKSWWWANTSVWGAPLAGTPDDSIALQGFEAGAASTEQKRTGLMAVLEFQPTDNFRSIFDLYYSKFDQDEIRRTLMSGMDTWGGASYSDFSTTALNGDNIVTGGTVDGVHPVALTSLNKRHDEIKAFGWNSQLEFGGGWTAVADLSYSKADRDERNAELQAGVVGPVSLLNLNVSTGPGRTTLTPSVDFGDAAAVQLSDPAGWGRDGRSQFPVVADELKSARLSFSREFESWANNLEVGANYSDRTKDMNRSEVYYNLLNGRAPVNLPSDMLIRPTSLRFGGIPGNVISFDFNNVLDTYYDVIPAAIDATPGRVWSVNEKVTTTYAKLGLKFDTHFPLHGNLGVQVIQADQLATGDTWNGTDLAPITGGKKYTDVLPSLNLIMDLPRDTYVRLGVAKTLSRPNVEDMRSGMSVSISTDPVVAWSASGGNPELEPWRADAYDISVEKYFGKRSYLSVAYFYKDLKNFVYSQGLDFDFSGFPVPPGTDPDIVIPTNIGTLTTMANGHSGLIAGVELAFTFDFGVLSDKLEGFGLLFNGSDTRSSLHEEDNIARPLDGLSGRVTNITAYYEDHGFSARVSQRHRSKFTTTVRGTFGDNILSRISEENLVDAQLGYAFEGRFQGLSLLLQVNNLTDEPYETQVGIDAGSVNANATMPERYTTYGREYLVGFNYRL